MLLVKRALWGVVPVSLLLAVFGGGWFYFALPNPATADRDGLVRWLVLRDISTLDDATQLALLDRMQEEFSSGPVVEMNPADLPASVAERLQNNLGHLQTVWFYTRVKQLAEMPSGEMDAFLDEQIVFAERWGDLAPESGQLDVFVMIDQWIDGAEGDLKEASMNGVRLSLSRFLRTRSVEKYPNETRLELANRIVEDLEYGARLDQQSAPSAPDEALMIRQNATLLLEAWLTAEALKYEQLDDVARQAYLDKRTKQIKEWGVIELVASQTTETQSSTQAMLAFAKESQAWIQRADPESQPALRTLLQDVAQRVLLGSW